jgi:hypothetical protein
MCTVSVVRFGEAIRLVCNRDEQRARPAARPPAVSTIAVDSIACPIDTSSGGTWVGVRGGAFVAALLNRTEPPRAASSRPTSRGSIVPAILACRSFDAAVDAATAIDPAAFAPFTLLIAGLRRAAIVSSREVWSPASCDIAVPLLQTSSSRGDALVEAPRGALFDALVRRAAAPLAGQHAFHRHRWPHRRDISVVMAREDAATVSRTTIDLTATGGSISYEGAPC